MHEHKDLSIATATITIKVIQVAGHKMTKATFRQIKFKHIVEWPEKNNVLGWVNDEGPILLWVENGKIYRSSILDWTGFNTDGIRVPATELLDQLFIAT